MALNALSAGAAEHDPIVRQKISLRTDVCILGNNAHCLLQKDDRLDLFFFQSIVEIIDIPELAVIFQTAFKLNEWSTAVRLSARAGWYLKLPSMLTFREG